MSSDGSIQLTCRCYGKADNAAAIKARNPTRDPLKRYGDTPLGEYDFSLGPKVGTDARNVRSYGNNNLIILVPVSGQALEAANNGRSGLLIHGGDLNSDGELRPTNGCIRVSNQDQAELVSLFAKYSPGKLTVTIYN